jgi:NAD(P)-dependent dehydrogenase (short-subunit alcohol dehydrogenase family)
VRLKGSNILVTGGSSGIGLALIKGFLEEGASVSFTYRTSQALDRPEVRDLLNQFTTIYPIKSDFSKLVDFEILLKNIAERTGSVVNVLVNNAAEFSREELINTKQEVLQKILTVNLLTPFMLISAFAKALIEAKNGGSIINISSLSATAARSKMAAYQSSKAGLEMLSKSAAYELGKYQIRSNIIAPGLTKTPANKEQWDKHPDIWAERSANIPLGRAGKPEDFVGAAIYLAMNDSQWVTGTKIIIDGGASTF